MRYLVQDPEDWVQVLVGTEKIRISVNGLLGDNPTYRYSLDYQEEELARFWTLPWGRGLLVSENHTVYLSKLLRTQVQTVR